MCPNFILIACFSVGVETFYSKITTFDLCDPCMTFWPLKVMWHKWEVVIVIVSKFGGNSLKHVEIMANWNVARKLVKEELTLVLRAELNIAAECEIVEIPRRDMLRKRVYLIMCSCRLGCCKVMPILSAI